MGRDSTRAVRRMGVRALATVALVLASGGVAAGDATSDVWREATATTKMHDQGYRGDGVTVAIIDTGVANVPGLHGAVIHQENLSAAPAEGDQYGHGTFVAGLVHRAAPGARIVSVKLSGANGAVDVSQVLAAMQWVVAHKERYSIDVVNLSFGNDSRQSHRTSPLNFAVQRAWDAGIVVVASAGNAGSATGTVTKPGDDPLVITVGSTNDAGTGVIDDDTIPDFVSRGPTQDGLAKPDVVAPGRSLVSLRAPGSTIDSQYPQARVDTDELRGSGTSFSAPIVSGVVAQLLSANPTLTPDEVKYALMAGARPVSGPAEAQGSGTVRAFRSHTFARGGRANANVPRGNGQGSMDADRGSMRVITIGDVASIELDGNVTAAGRTFDQAEYTASQWGASQWGASQWGASQWGASQWGASQWGASQWWASQWG